MKADTSPALLTHFLQDDMYLISTDKAAYSFDEPVAPALAEPEPVKIEAGTTPAVTPAPVEVTPAITFQYMGGNKKNFLVLTHYPAATHIAIEHLTPLMSTLARLNYTEDDIAILNMATANNAWDKIAAFFKPAKLLVLGSKAFPAGITALPVNQVQQAAGLQALQTFAFDEMMTSTDNKKIFWNLVKTF